MLCLRRGMERYPPSTVHIFYAAILLLSGEHRSRTVRTLIYSHQDLRVNDNVISSDVYVQPVFVPTGKKRGTARQSRCRGVTRNISALNFRTKFARYEILRKGREYIISAKNFV
jgi:hypothetical protein